MKRLTSLFTLLCAGLLLMGADGCSSDPNVEGAKLHLRNKDYDQALENLNTAIEANPDNAEAYELKGQVLQEQAANTEDLDTHVQIIEEMTTAYDRAVELNPELTETVNQRMLQAYYTEFQRGVQAFNRGKNDDAEFATAAAYFGVAATLQPDSSGAYVNQAYALINSGDQMAAIEPFEMAVETGDMQPETYTYLSSLYIQNDQAEDAVTTLERAREAFPGNEEVQAQLLNAYIEAGQVDRAKQVYTEAVENDPDNPLYRYNLGTLLLQAEDYAGAIEQLERAVELDQNYASAYYNLGASYTNLAADINDQIREMDDNLRENRSDMDDDTISATEAEMDQLVEERRQMFEKAVVPLEKARELTEAEGGDAQSICGALYVAYAQTNQSDKAQEVASCAGYDQ